MVKSALVFCRSPVETKSTNTSLDGPVNRVHPGARIHLLPTVCRDRTYTAHWIFLSITMRRWSTQNVVPALHEASWEAVQRSICRHSLAGMVPPGAWVLSRNKDRKHDQKTSQQWLTDWQMSCSTTDLKCDLWGDEHYQPAGFGLQLWALWNRNHMRGVFRSIKTNTQRLNRN